MKLVFSPKAILDLDEILDYVGRNNPSAALRLIDRLEERCQALIEMRSAGTRRDDLAPGLRALSQGSYVIYFVVQTSEMVRIVRVMHGARDVRPIDFRPSP